jgi:sec-independent protein translocase protein TatA
MGGFSLWHWLIVLLVAAVLFGGRGKISGVMGDFAKGIKAFKAGLKEEDEAKAAPESQPRVTQQPGQAAGAAPAEARPGERA